jgi:hypothetical protein
MPDWESELGDLLRSLNVALEPEEPDQADEPVGASLALPVLPVLPVSLPRGGALADESDPSDSTVRAFERSTEQAHEASTPEEEEVSAIRREIEATVARVVHLTRTGQLDPALRDDVVFVLRALTRACPTGLDSDARDEWHLASAAAVLHFCRVVLRLTRPLAPE